MDETRTVRRRKVFYIPGFDPFPPRRYREIYRREAARQAAVSGHAITLSPRSGDGEHSYCWQLDARIEAADVTTDYCVLTWSDIARRSTRQGVGATYLLLARTFWIYLATGAMVRLFRLRKGPVVAALYPVAVLLAQLGLALSLGWALGRLLVPVMPVWGAHALGLAVMVPVLHGFRRIDNRIYAYYLMHYYGFTARHRGRHPPQVEARLGCFARRIAHALETDADEVLLVGHSSGAHLAVSVMADLIRAGQLSAARPAVALLTLGQEIPVQSFLPEAGRLRADLALLARAEQPVWVDVTAPGDGCSFALCDPVAVSGVAPPPEQKRWPLVISAAFSQTLLPQTWARLKRRFYRVHFQYICAFDNPGDYDYFAITAGPRRLSDRFAGRAPSASRKEDALSPHTDCTPAS